MLHAVKIMYKYTTTLLYNIPVSTGLMTFVLFDFESSQSSFSLSAEKQRVGFGLSILLVLTRLSYFNKQFSPYIDRVSFYHSQLILTSGKPLLNKTDLQALYL